MYTYDDDEIQDINNIIDNMDRDFYDGTDYYDDDHSYYGDGSDDSYYDEEFIPVIDDDYFDNYDYRD